MGREPTTPAAAPITRPPNPLTIDASIEGKLDADRLCSRCAHQLAGQTVYRDQRLNLLFLRCPECGTAAAVTEFPIAGRWMRRFGAAVIALMLILGFALLVADVAASTGCIYMASWESAREYVNTLQETARAMPQAAGPQAAGGIPMIDYMAPVGLVDDQAALARIGATPGLADAALARFWLNIIPGVIAGAASGVVWTMVLMHRPLRRGWIWLFAPSVLSCGIALFIYWMSGLQSTRINSISGVSYYDLAFRTFGWHMLLMAMGITVVVRFIAFFAARPVARAMAAVFIPAKLRRAVAEEWCDPAPRIAS
jgi:hypothetical protein